MKKELRNRELYSNYENDSALHTYLGQKIGLKRHLILYRSPILSITIELGLRVEREIDKNSRHHSCSSLVTEMKIKMRKMGSYIVGRARINP